MSLSYLQVPHDSGCLDITSQQFGSVPILDNISRALTSLSIIDKKNPTYIYIRHLLILPAIELYIEISVLIWQVLLLGMHGMFPVLYE